MKHPLLLAALPVLAFSLACGGMSKDIASKNFVEQTVELQSVADGPEKVEVGRYLDEAWLQAQDGKLGFTESMDWDIHFDKAISDGVISNAELIELRGDGVRFTPPPTSDAARESRLAAKRIAETEEAAKMAEEAAGNFSDWRTSKHIMDGLVSAGWNIDDCDSYDDGEYVKSVSCSARKDDMYADVNVDHYRDLDDARYGDDDFSPGFASKRDYKSVLSVMVLNGKRAAELRDKVAPEGTSIKGRDLAWAKAQIKAAGWSASDCDESHEDGYHDFDCDLGKGKDAGDFSLAYEPDGYGESSRSIDQGAAYITEDSGYLSISVYDTAEADKLMAELLTPPAPASPPAP